jgi:acyl carrier protein
MPSQEIVTRVVEVIAKARRMPPEMLTLDKSFEDLNMDSLDALNLVFELESAFDIEVPDEAVRQIRTVRQMVEGVEQLLAQKAAGVGSAK